MTNIHVSRCHKLALCVFISLILFILTGCVGVGNQVRLLPTPDEKWQNDPANYLRDDTVIYNCEETKIEIREVLIKGRLYAVGLILPIIPMPVGYDETKKNPNLEIDVILRTKSDRTILEKDDVSIKIDNNSHTPTHMVLHNQSVGSYKYYKYYFDLPRSTAKLFQLEFNRPINNCSIPPVVFKISDKVKIGVAAQ